MQEALFMSRRPRAIARVMVQCRNFNTSGGNRKMEIIRSNDHLTHHNGIFYTYIMTTSSNGNLFRVTGPLGGEFTGHRWIPLTKASDAELWRFFCMCLNKRFSKPSRHGRFQTPSPSLWRHSNVYIELRLRHLIIPSARTMTRWCSSGYS